MGERIALLGFVNTEEILADTIKTQTPEVQVDGYELFPNEAFGRAVDTRYPLYGVDASGTFGLTQLERLRQLSSIGYAAINLGPIPAAYIAEPILLDNGTAYIGPRQNELPYETDKTRISEIFPESSGVLPPTRILTRSDISEIQSALDALGGDVVLKFVGEYSNYYQDSETRRVRMLDEFESMHDLQGFVTHSIEASGKVIIQKRINGQQFSYTAIVDGNGGIFRFGENICYKHRHDGETGPLGDGTGSVSVNNTLPALLTPDDISFVQESVVKPYVRRVGEALGRAPQTFLNVDLIKDGSGRIYLLEVNNREPGGHTMASLLSGLRTPLAEVLEATQQGRVGELTPAYNQGASVVISAYPENFPHPFDNEADRPLVTIPKLKNTDTVKIYTGWVDVEADHETDVVARAKLSPTMLFSTHAPTLRQAADRVYESMRQIVPDGFDYRKDIGL